MSLPVVQSGPVQIGDYLRDGYCCGCGECCLGDPFNGTEGIAQIPGACPLLGLHGCTNKEHEYYKQACIFFPQHPSQIVDKPSCTYTFTKVDSNGAATL